MSSATTAEAPSTTTTTRGGGDDVGPDHADGGGGDVVSGVSGGATPAESDGPDPDANPDPDDRGGAGSGVSGSRKSSLSSMFSCLSALGCIASPPSSRRRSRDAPPPSSTTEIRVRGAAETTGAGVGAGAGAGDDPVGEGDGGGDDGGDGTSGNGAEVEVGEAIPVAAATAAAAAASTDGEEERKRSFADSPPDGTRKKVVGRGILKRLSGNGDRSSPAGKSKTSSRARAELRSVYHDAHEHHPPRAPSRSRSRSSPPPSAYSGVSSISRGGEETLESDVDVDEAVARLAELLAGSDSGEANVGGPWEEGGGAEQKRERRKKKKKSSVYFDAFDSHRDSMTMTTEMQIFGVMYDPSDLGTYAPATVANRHPRQSVSMVDPDTMLHHESSGELEAAQKSKRLSSFLSRRRSSAAATAAAEEAAASITAVATAASEASSGAEKRKSASSSVIVVPPTTEKRRSTTTSVSTGEKKRRSSASVMRRRSTEFVRRNLRRPRVRVALRGYPGELTEDELAACQEFRLELRRREEREVAETGGDGAAYRQMVDAFSVVEEEPYALCRFLRARNFDVSRVLDMMEGGVDVWREGRAHGFHPDADDAVGAPVSVLLTQYPFLYHGSANNGCPVSYFRAGAVSVEGVECVTDLDRLTNLAWHSMMHTFPDQVRTSQEVDPDVVRCESIAVFDLKGLSASQLNARTLEILKKVVKINICFPEVLNCMVILNAPGFFSFSWRVIKTFLDARTASKIAIFADEKRGREWLLYHIDEGELLSDYGGKSVSFDAAMRAQGGGIESLRRVVELLTITPRAAESRFDFDLASDEKIDLRVYTRSCAGADFVLLREGAVAKTAEVRNPGMVSPAPFNRALASAVNGPGRFQIVATSKISSGSDYFLVVGWVNRNVPETSPS